MICPDLLATSLITETELKDQFLFKICLILKFLDFFLPMSIGNSMIKSLPNRIRPFAITINKCTTWFKVPIDSRNWVAFSHAFDCVFMALTIKALRIDYFRSNDGFGSDNKRKILRSAEVSVGHFECVRSQVGEFGFVDP